MHNSAQLKCNQPMRLPDPRIRAQSPAPPAHPPMAIGVHTFPRMAKGSVFITIERCKGCGFCVEFCPTHVLSLSSAFNSKGYHPPHVIAAEKCSGCDLCGLYCPDFAIYGARHAS